MCAVIPSTVLKIYFLAEKSPYIFAFNKNHRVCGFARMYNTTVCIKLTQQGLCQKKLVLCGVLLLASKICRYDVPTL